MNVNAIAIAITEGFKLVGKIMSGSERRRTRKAIDAGEDYILINEDMKMNKRTKEKKLVKAKTVFFNNNN